MRRNRVRAIALAMAVQFGVAFAASVYPTPASAAVTVIVIIVLKSGLTDVINSAIQQLFGGNRGAIAIACVGSYCQQQTDTGSFFGHADAQANANDDHGKAFAHARNSLSGKTLQPTGGSGLFSAFAGITWKGELIDHFSTYGLGDPLPDPSDVASASYSATWDTSFTDIGFTYPSDQNASGSLGVDLTMSGADVFSGGASAVGENATFTGDMIPLAGQFVANDGLSASGLNVSGTLTGPVDYPSFYDDPELTFNLSGSAYAEASGTPEPSMWAMMAIGFVGLGYVARRRRQQFRRF